MRGKTPFESCVTLRQYAPFEEGPRSQSILLHGQSDTLHIRFVTLFGITVALLRSGLVRNESVHNAAMLALLSRLRFLHVLGIFMARQRRGGGQWWQLLSLLYKVVSTKYRRRRPSQFYQRKLSFMEDVVWYQTHLGSFRNQARTRDRIAFTLELQMYHNYSFQSFVGNSRWNLRRELFCIHS